METSLVFIHGFLGLPSDWQPVVSHLKKQESYFLDLNKDFPISELSFQAWPQAFKNWMRTQKISKPVQLVGYSLGGRLGLPLLEQGLVQTLTMLSSHIGMPETSLRERVERRLVNQKWAEVFLNEKWGDAVGAWGQQDVFRGTTFEPKRLEENYDRSKLAALLTGFSISEQKDYRDLLNKNRICFLTGENDKKYSELTNNLKKNFPKMAGEVISQAGHRLIFDQPRAVADRIQLFIDNFI